MLWLVTGTHVVITNDFSSFLITEKGRFNALVDEENQALECLFLPLLCLFYSHPIPRPFMSACCCFFLKEKSHNSHALIQSCGWWPEIGFLFSSRSKDYFFWWNPIKERNFLSSWRLDSVHKSADTSWIILCNYLTKCATWYDGEMHCRRISIIFIVVW